MATQTQQTTNKPAVKKKVNLPRKSWNYYMPWIVGILGAAWVTELLLVAILGDTLHRQVTESFLVEEQKLAEQQSLGLLSTYDTKIKAINGSLPEEAGVIEFVQDLKNKLSQFTDPELGINTNEPVKTAQFYAPLVPVSMSAVATPSAFLQVVDKISQSQYLFQPVILEVNALDGMSAPARINYKGNLYVSPELVE